MKTTATPEANPVEIQQEYRNCRLVIESTDQAFQSSVYRGDLKIGECRRQTFADAVQALRSVVDDYYEERIASRTIAPNDTEYQTAIQEILQWLTPNQKQLLAAHLRAEKYQCHIDELLQISGIHSTIRLLLVYAAMARRLSDALAYIPSLNAPVIDPIVAVLMSSTGILSTKRGEPRTLQLQADVGNALDKVNGYRFTENIS